MTATAAAPPGPASSSCARVALLGLLLLGCSYTTPYTQCPTCIVFERSVPAPTVPPGTRVLVVLVEGLLGFGWEWDEPLVLLRRLPDALVEVFHWSPLSGVGTVARDLGRRLDAQLATAPPSLRRVLVVGHSAGGLVTAQAAGALHIPTNVQLHIVNVGAPYAGMHTTPFESEDNLWAPLGLTMGGTFTRYPRPAPRVTVESWVTTWPGDPVMQPRFHHDPGDPRVGPPGPRHVLPPGTDHNRVVFTIVEDALKHLQ